MTQQAIFRVGIVGGGLSGTCLLAELSCLFKDTPNVEIVLIEKNQTVGPGLPYTSHLNDNHILNHYMDNMGYVIDPEKPNRSFEDFYNWVQENRESKNLDQECAGFDLSNRTAFVPRRLYGYYLEDRYLKIKEFNEKNGTQFQTIHSEATDVKMIDNNLYHLTTKDGQEFTFNNILLATGHWDQAKEQNKDFICDSRYPESYEKKVAGKVVAIQGIGLSGYEAAIDALAHGAEKIIMFSRTGTPRRIRPETVEMNYENKYLTVEHLTDIKNKNEQTYFSMFDILQQIRLEAINFYKEQDKKNGRTRDVASLYDKAWRRFEEMSAPERIAHDLKYKSVERKKTGLKKPSPWRSIFVSTFKFIEDIYDQMDKKDFMSNYFTKYNSHLAPMPPQTAEKIINYVNQEKILMVSAFEHHMDLESPQPNLKINGLKYPFDILIQATGQDRNILSNQLYQALNDKSIVRTNPVGGLDINVRSMSLPNHPHIHTYGPPSLGTFTRIGSSNTLSENATWVAKQIANYHRELNN